MKLTRTGAAWIVATLCMLLGAFYLLRRDKPQSVALPYHDAFARQQAREWTPLGGFWRLQDGAVINGSDASGSKLLLGSPAWSNYQITTTLRLLAHGGDVGVILRVSDAEVGVNAYRGYYVGLRSNDASLVMGRANYSWLEAKPVAMGEPVRTGRWYRLHVVAFGCTLAAEVVDLATGVHRYAAMQDDPRACITSGRTGLRSTDTGSAWKQVSIAKATQSDLHRLVRLAPALSHPAYPVLERDLYRMRKEVSPAMYPFSTEEDDAPDPAPEGVKGEGQAIPLVTSLGVHTGVRAGQTVRLHGVISSISPFYLQDATGGVRLLPPDPGALCIGDELDVTGRVAGSAWLPVLVVTELGRQRDHAAPTVTSISPVQAASGMYEGSLVAIVGKLVSREVRSDGSVVLQLHADGQNFEAVLQNDPFSTQKQQIQDGSRVRVRGIATIDANDTSGGSFRILAQSAANIDVLAQPSWLEGWRLILLVGLGLMTTCFFLYFILRASRVRMAAVAAERERLSHEVHDTLAQSFAGISFRLQGLRKRACMDSLTREMLMTELDEMYGAVAGTHREASAIIAALRPGSHGCGDLLTLIERASEQLFAGQGPTIETLRRGVPCELDPALADAFFRVALEGIANVLRHSQASLVRLCLEFSAEAVTLWIEDDGVGFPVDATEPHFGLQTMQKRCDAVKARLRVVSAPGNGTRVAVTAPRRRRPQFLFAVRSACAPGKARGNVSHTGFDCR